MKYPVLFLALLAASPAMAQSVGDCDWRASAQAIVEPWADYSATFANGAVRLAYLDTIEPGLAPAHILILSPPYDELGSRQCRVVSLNGTMGFSDVYWNSLSAGYDPARGLLFDINVSVHEPSTDTFKVRGLAITLNQSTGAITTRLQAALD